MTLKRLLFAVILTVIAPLCAHAQAVGNIQGWCENGNEKVITSGLTSTTTEQQSHPRCVVTIYNHGAGLATIYSDIASTPLTNPFTATTNGQWQFYGAAGRYDITMTSGTPQPFPFPVSYLDVPIFGSNGVCTTVLQTNGVANTNQCLLDLQQGTNITITNVAGVTTINASGGGCTLPGNDTAVLSEHPVGTCYNSADFTWDDTGHNLINGDGTITEGTDGASLKSLLFAIGGSTTALHGTEQMSLGFGNTLGASTISGNTDFFTVGSSDTSCTASGSTGCAHLYVLGHGSSMETIAGSGVTGGGDEYSVGFNQIYSNVDNGFTVGHDVHLESASTTDMSDLYVLCDSCHVTLSDTSTIAEEAMVGQTNTLTVSGISNAGDNAIVGRSNSMVVGTGSNEGDHVVLGNSNVTTVSGSGTDADFTAEIGFANTDTISNAEDSGHLLLAGSANTAVASSSSLTYAAAVGNTNALANCDHCYAFGDTVHNSTSNSLDIGMSNSSELKIVAGQVAVAAHLNQGSATTWAGICTLGTSCGITFGTAYTSTPVCVATDQTNADAVKSVPSTGGVTFTGNGTDVLAWMCIGNPN